MSVRVERRTSRNIAVSITPVSDGDGLESSRRLIWSSIGSSLDDKKETSRGRRGLTSPSALLRVERYRAAIVDGSSNILPQ